MPAAPLVIWGMSIAWSTVVAIGITVASVAYSYLKRPGTPPKADTVAGAAGIKINSRSTQEPVRVVYGTRKVGGNVVFMETSGTDNTDLYLIVGLSEGVCDSVNQVSAVDQIWLNDALASTYGANAVCAFHSGTAAQTVDAATNTAFTGWTDCLRNTCYLAVKLIFDRNKFQSVPTVLVELKGRKLYDVRDASTAYSENPVLALYDYMTNERYGMGFASTSIDTDSWEDAADYCDTKGWTLNMCVSSNEPAVDVRDAILSHFRGSLVWYDGKYYLRYADLNVEASCMTLTDDDVIAEENGKAVISISEGSMYGVPDAVRVRWVDPDKSYADDDFIIGDDTGVVKQVDLIGCTDRDQATQLAIYNLERWKLNRVITGRFGDRAMALEPHDVITLTSDALGISSQLMRVNEANIAPDGTVELILIYEDTTLYDDNYNITLDNVYTCSLPDPKLEPPSVMNAAIAEETYNYRLRTFTRVLVTFDPPPDYPWYDQVEVWQSFDDVTWEHMFDSTSDFEIANVVEGQMYYLRLKVVSIWGTKQLDANDYKVGKMIVGFVDEPSSLASLEAIVNANCVNLFSSKVDDPDVELYEFRLGATWTSAIFLASLRSPNLSLYGVKPGDHTFWVNTLSNNGSYGSTPRSAAVSLIDPPDAWSVIAQNGPLNYITNGTMEADANWADWGTPASNTRSDTQKYEGSYSRKFTVNATGEGIKSDTFTSYVADYGWSAWVYADDHNKVTVVIRNGDDTGWDYSVEHTVTQDAWTFISGTYASTVAGASAYMVIHCGGVKDSGSWYVDNVCLFYGTFDNCIPFLYSSDSYVRGLHTGGGLVGTWTSRIFDRGSSDHWLTYVTTGYAFLGAGTDWQDAFAAAEHWNTAISAGTLWKDIFKLENASIVEIDLKHGDASPPANTTRKQEILSALVDARYMQVVITITDPNSTMYTMVGTGEVDSVIVLNSCQ